MEKRIYYAPCLERVSMEAEMPVICASAPGEGGNINGFTPSAGSLV